MENAKIDIKENGISLVDAIKKYMETNKLHISILTPCYGGQCFASYTTSLVKTILIFKELGINVSVTFMGNESLISRGRNNLIGKTMLDDTVTHFMFIDSDITWKAEDILKLIISDKSLVGGVYPKKNYDWKKLKEPGVINSWIDKKNTINSNISDDLVIKSNLLSFNINHISKELRIENNIMKIKHLATGFMLIKRHVIEEMIQKFSDTHYIDTTGFISPNDSKYTYALFDCAVIDGHYYSEDWLFCHRWTNMGGEIYADVSIDLTHTGTENYEGNLMLNLLTSN